MPPTLAAISEILGAQEAVASALAMHGVKVVIEPGAVPHVVMAEKKIVLPVMQDVKGENLARLRGYVDHEAAHIFGESSEPILKSVQEEKRPILEHLLRIAEDARVDNLYTADYMPGCRGNVMECMELCAKEWNIDQGIKAALLNVFFAGHGITRDFGKDLKGPEAEILRKLTDAVGDSPRAIMHAKNTQQALDAVRDLAAAWEKIVPQDQQEQMRKMLEAKVEFVPSADGALGKMTVYPGDRASQERFGDNYNNGWDTIRGDVREGDHIDGTGKDAAGSIAQALTTLTAEWEPMRQRLMADLSTKAYPIKRNQKRGRLDVRRLAKTATGGTDVFLHKCRGRQIDTGVTMIVDSSSSMSGQKINYAKGLALTLSRTFAELQVPFEVLSFGNDCVKCLAPFEGSSRLERESAIARVGAWGGTPLSAALRAAWKRIAWRKERRKLAIMLSDGQADQPDDFKNLCGAIQKDGTVELIAVDIHSNATEGVVQNRVALDAEELRTRFYPRLMHMFRKGAMK